MTFQNKVKSIGLTSLDSATLTANYQAINPNGLEKACFLLRIVNDSTSDITISYDGTNDHDHLAGTAAAIPRETLTLDFTSSPPFGGYVFIPKGTVVYLKGSAGVGVIYLSGYYQSGA